jgi:2-polyprenyl-3-methyl-5-hydroxy-6-metoxy-1,4-benzoquinol methylase
LNTGQLSDVSGQFQIITMFHVLEHIPDPVLTFERLWKLIENDGHVFIEVPNIETSKTSPHNIYFRAHIHYFSEATLVASASPYFEKIYSEKNSNLRIIFKKKEIIEDLVFPNSKQISHTTKRLKDKGWIEYLLRGRGYQKIFSRIKQATIESSLRNKDSLGLLDELIKNQ